MFADPMSGGMFGGPQGDQSGLAGVLAEYLRSVMSGQIAASGPLGQNFYDPNRSFAQNALDPRAIESATDIALSLGAGPMRARRGRGEITLGQALPAVDDIPALAAASGHNSAMFPQYAEAYPPVGPPKTKIGDRGNLFESKVLTPEAKAFSKERLRVQADMDKNGYSPYFDPAERSYVDPSNYPPANVDTSTLVPKRAATVDEYQSVIGAPETTQALRQGFARGEELGNADHWYAMRQLEKKHIDVLGEDAGRAAFLDEFAAPMAATTSGQNPTANLLMAHYLEYMRKQGLEPPVGHQLPFPIGGQYAGTNLDNYASMREGGGYPWFGAGQPKMHNFTRSFLGDLSHPVIDDQMAAGMLPHAPTAKFPDNARKSAYGLMEAPVNIEAARLGIQPGNVQDVAWAGFKNETGKPMISIINEAIERTRRLTNMPVEEIVVRGLIKKEIPLYGLAGAGAFGMAANPYDQGGWQ
jgi:hypothetical protein